MKHARRRRAVAVCRSARRIQMRSNAVLIDDEPLRPQVCLSSASRGRDGPLPVPSTATMTPEGPMIDRHQCVDERIGVLGDPHADLQWIKLAIRNLHRAGVRQIHVLGDFGSSQLAAGTSSTGSGCSRCSSSPATCFRTSQAATTRGTRHCTACSRSTNGREYQLDRAHVLEAGLIRRLADLRPLDGGKRHHQPPHPFATPR